MCKGANTTTSTTAPNPQAAAAYSSLLGQASSVAATPYTPYTGELNAPVNAQQTLGINDINQNAGFAQPYIGQAANYANQAAAPITGQQIAGFESPYTQQVVNATQAQFNNQNAQQQSALQGNAISAGALGGDRAGVAAANLSGQQSLAQAPVIAGLENQGFQTAEQTALAEQQNLGNAAYSLGNLGVAGQNAALTGANAQVGAGTLQQQTQQGLDTAQYQQFEQALAYPFQTTQWLAGIDTGVGSQLGGTSTTTAPAPNPLAQFAGLGVAAAGAFAPTKTSARGGRIAGFASGGASDFLAGTPFSGVSGWVPTSNITGGSGAPKPPGTPSQASTSQNPSGSAWVNAGKGFSNLTSGFGSSGISTGGDALGISAADYGAASAAGAATLDAGAATAGASAGGLGDLAMLAMLKRGGKVRGFAGGGLADDAGINDIGADPAAGFGDRFGGQYTPNFNDEFGNFPDPTGSDLKTFSQPSSSGALEPYFDMSGARDVPMPPERPAMAGLDVPLPTPRPDPATLPDDSVPASGGNPLAGFAPVPGQPGAPAIPGQQEAGFGSSFGLSPAVKAGLLAAGFGMLASRSPNLGNAVGEGGLQGINAYSGQIKQEQETKKSDAAIEHAKKQLEQHAKETADHLALETKKMSQAAEFHQDTVKHQDDLAAEAQRLHDIQMKRIEAQIEQGNYTATPGKGLDPQTGQPVDGSYLLNKKTGATEFRAGMIQTPKAAAASEPSFDKPTLTKMADQYMAGDKSVLVNLGRGAQGAADLRALRQRIAERMDEKGVSPEQQAVKMAEFGGLAAGERALGTRTATIEMAANEARNMMKPALEAAAAIPRTNWVPINKLIEGWQSGVVSDPAQAKFAAANFSLVNTYVRAIAPTGVPPESARNHAMGLLSGAMGHDAYKAVVDQMNTEMEAALRSPGQVQQKFREMYGNAPASPAAAAGNATGVTPTTVRQNGHTYQKGPDGLYKAID